MESLRAQDQETPEKRRRRKEWEEQIMQLDPPHWVFVEASDEVTEMRGRYGRAPRGEWVREATPAGRWSPLTLVGAMREKGVLATMIRGDAHRRRCPGDVSGTGVVSPASNSKAVCSIGIFCAKALLLRFGLTRNGTACHQTGSTTEVRVGSTRKANSNSTAIPAAMTGNPITSLQLSASAS